MEKRDKFEKILSWINRNPWENQRILAANTGLSLGTVNQALKMLEKEEYLEKRGSGYELTGAGENYLASIHHDRQMKKLVLSGSARKIRSAVILAAGDNPAFSQPEGLLSLADTTVMERILKILYKNGIEHICMVVGAKEEQYRAVYEGRPITLITNPRYKWSGTMYSLARAQDFIKEDFLLVESNQIFEETAVEAVLSAQSDNCILMTVPSGSQDEAYVELGADHTVFRISKDIRQMNRIDGEAVGISKITKKMFDRMIAYYENNTNPMLNYEYVLESIGRTYGIEGVMVNDLVWTVIENEEHYRRVKNRIYPEILKREQDARENKAREILKNCLQLADGEIGGVRTGGGMTNSNYFAEVRGEPYILRIPGACTEEMIDRAAEYDNSTLAAKLGINPENIYFDIESGVKVTRCIKDAVTFNGKTARLEQNIRKTTSMIRKLHDSDLVLKGEFSVLNEYEKYKKMMTDRLVVPYEGFEKMDRLFYRLMERLDDIGLERKPCHNDLVAENFVMSGDGRLYLIDWEYSGMNDSMWDVASHLLECGFDQNDEELFLQYYFPEGIDEISQEKILIFKISQDILWSAWTMVKEHDGENFGTYGRDRLLRAAALGEEYDRAYGKK